MQLMVLDKNDTWEEHSNKLLEETEELRQAICLNNKENVAEEALDVIQVAIGVLDKLESEGYNIKQLVCRHLKKAKKEKMES